LAFATTITPTPSLSGGSPIMTWSLPDLLEELHKDLQHRLERCRKSFSHPVVKGNASEQTWLELFQTYLPKRYQAETAFVVDSQGKFSDQIDVVIFDRQYSPFIFSYQGQKIIPAESVYAVFEAKQSINAEHLIYAHQKVASVRQLHRTSLPIPHAGGIYPAKPLIPILGGILTFESDWSPPMDKSLLDVLVSGKDGSRLELDLGCIAAHGYFRYDEPTANYVISTGDKPATAFLFDLISMLQFSGTVPMIDIQAYAQWLTVES
jgi:hypothetical protein